MTLVVCPNLAIDRVLQVDALRPGRVMRCRSLLEQAGGKGANVARALRALGDAPDTAGRAPALEPGDPALLAGFAAGHGGRLIAELAADEGIAAELVVTGGEARVSTVVLTDEGTPTRLFEFGPTIDAADERALLALVAGRPAAPGEWAIVDGAAPPGSSPGFYGDLVRALRAGGYRVLVDAEGGQLLGALREHPDLVKVNLAEAASAVGTPVADAGDAEPTVGNAAHAETGGRRRGAPPPAQIAAGFDACHRLVDAGAAGAAVTLGAAGATAVIGGRAWSVRTPAVASVNPVGSGDCFAAALVLALARGECPESALATAAGTGAANAAHPLTGHFDVALARDLAVQATVATSAADARRSSAAADRPSAGPGGGPSPSWPLY